MQSQPLFTSLQKKQVVIVDVVWYGLLLVTLWVVDFIGLGKSLTAVSSLLVVPALERTTQVVSALETPYSMVRNGYSSTKRIQDLELQYSQVLAEVGELQSLRQENQALRDLLGNSDRTLVDSVITRPIISFAHPTVAVGLADGIEEGALVLVGKTVVGVVQDVSEKTAKVALLSQVSSNPIVAKTETGTEGIIIGDGKRVLLTEVPRDADIEVGERVVTVGQPGVPADVLVGVVASIETQPSDPVKEVMVEQVVNFYQATLVEVLR